ncbi:patatin-like phospholipase family protein [Colwellia sp. Bg11-28]|uniref:patatin-like phospholipase family protein n=1 Tax=Colwellia sp. Bg11-28 TaxID=2058305 RepID=UPI000C34FCE3|nr:patatin-like phospholipase family protein [Colwellia sp. Bg11-28]PKH86736.1 patatin [Colwellia sp. Bg11-28]
MRFIITLFLILQLTTLAFSAHSRDKIGLVLSGGGAKGSAHIGVLKVLEQHNIPIDYVVGTSIGAYVGGMYALGYEVSEIEAIMLGMPWDESYSDFIPRESLAYDKKQHRDRYNISIRLGYSDGEFKVPHGLLLGQSAYQILQRSTDTVRSFDSFDDLAIPYRAVASDIATAKMVVLDSGSINEAMKASAAVPGIVAAVEIDGKTLVDGGITNNMPIDVIKAMGADIVIAIDIGSPLAEQSELTSTVSVLNQLSTILTNNTSLAQKALLTDKDILLRPAIDKLSTTDWSVMPEALKLGEQEAQAQSQALMKLAISDVDYQAYKNQKKLKAKKWFDALPRHITKIKINNNSKVENDIIEKVFAIELGKKLTKEALDLAINRVYALDKFEQVTVEFDDSPEGRIITLTTQAKSWGPNYFDFGFNLKTDFSDQSITSINMSYLMTNVSMNGGRWLNELELGWESLLASEFYQPLDHSHDIYSRARVSFAQDKWEKTSFREELRNEYYQATLALGYDYSFKGIIELGVIAETGDLSLDKPGTDDFDYDSYGSFITFGYDTLDSINFPTNGNKLLIEVKWLKDEYSPQLSDVEKDTATTFALDWRGAIGIRGHTFVGIASFATIDNESDFSVHVTELGGFLNLSGYQEDALIGVHKVFAAVVYQYDLGREIPGGSGLPIYLGTSLEAGNVWGGEDRIRYNDLISSGSIYLGTDTSFGPAVLGMGFATSGEHSFFLSIGKNW